MSEIDEQTLSQESKDKEEQEWYHKISDIILLLCSFVEKKGPIQYTIKTLEPGEDMYDFVDTKYVCTINTLPVSNIKVTYDDSSSSSYDTSLFGCVNDYYIYDKNTRLPGIILLYHFAKDVIDSFEKKSITLESKILKRLIELSPFCDKFTHRSYCDTFTYNSYKMKDKIDNNLYSYTRYIKKRGYSEYKYKNYSEFKDFFESDDCALYSTPSEFIDKLKKDRDEIIHTIHSELHKLPVELTELITAYLFY